MPLTQFRGMFGASPEDVIAQAKAVLEEEANVLAIWEERQPTEALPGRVAIACKREARRLRFISESLYGIAGLDDPDQEKED